MTQVQIVLSRHRGKKMLLDTNLWMLLLIGNFDKAKIGSHKRVREYTEHDFTLLKSFIEFFKLIVTPNILTEISNLTSDVSDDVKQNLLRYLGGMVSLIDEEYVQSKIVDDQVLRKFGLCDSVIYHIAQSGTLILTADLPLYGYLASKNLAVLNFNHIRSQFILNKH